MELAQKGLLAFKENDQILSPGYANSINDIYLINSILRRWRYTRECYEYDVVTKKLTQVLPIKA